ncbi:NIPSNAP family protein [Streptomyces sp. NPDC096032]|uniref:NIPSNAP family protein n=1 Tax=Streptomyces sp. NPDC096032 TaxID=3366070 RepID=UPI0037F80A9E
MSSGWGRSAGQQLCLYTLCNSEALVAYENIWSKYIPAMAKHRITTHGIWTVPAASGSEMPQLGALVSYGDDDGVQERLLAYLASPTLHADMVAETMLMPTAGSPLR